VIQSERFYKGLMIRDSTSVYGYISERSDEERGEELTSREGKEQIKRSKS
jgi:hypothetical protein